VKALLANGANANAKDEGGWTALMSAALGGNAAVIELLLARGAHVNAKSKEPFQTMLNSASMETKLGAQRKFLKELGESDWTALMSAVAAGNLDAVRALLRGGADVNAKSRFDWTALKIAHTEGHREIEKLLIASGAKE
jgi:ankyrin repeat protein